MPATLHRIHTNFDIKVTVTGNYDGIYLQIDAPEKHESFDVLMTPERLNAFIATLTWAHNTAITGKVEPPVSS